MLVDIVVDVSIDYPSLVSDEIRKIHTHFDVCGFKLLKCSLRRKTQSMIVIYEKKAGGECFTSTKLEKGIMWEIQSTQTRKEFAPFVSSNSSAMISTNALKKFLARLQGFSQNGVSSWSPTRKNCVATVMLVVLPENKLIFLGRSLLTIGRNVAYNQTWVTSVTESARIRKSSTVCSAKPVMEFYRWGSITLRGFWYSSHRIRWHQGIRRHSLLVMLIIN